MKVYDVVEELQFVILFVLFSAFRTYLKMSLSTLANNGVVGREIINLGVLIPNMSGFTLRVQIQESECKSVNFSLASPGKRTKEG